MPELPEVERSRKALAAIATGRRIKSVRTTEDTIVFSSVPHSVFASSCEGKIVKEVQRKGKNFYMILESSLFTPIFHLGMAGSTQTKGKIGDTYRLPRAKNDGNTWPPKYVKACFTFEDVITGEEVGEWAFCDSRRLGRIKLIEGEDVEAVPPLSLLGRDPFLDMPDLDWIVEKLSKRNAPVKAVLLDQNGPFCGIGNWMVDEILYQARIHPAHISSALTIEQFTALHTQIRDVTATAVAVNAESSLFPKDWLFRSRWGKGKKGRGEFTLPNGEKTKITFITVGGRTSAVIEALQVLPTEVLRTIEAGKAKRAASKSKSKGKGKAKRGAEDSEEDDDAEDLEEEDEEEAVKEEISGTSPHFRKNKKLKIEDSVPPPSPKFKLPESLVSPTKNTRSRGAKS